VTFLAYGVAAVVAVAGSRLSAAIFVVAAVVAARQGIPGAAAMTWTAAMAGALIVAGISPRRVAVPAIGAAAAIAAGAAGNAAIVLALWTIGTAAAVASPPPGGDGRRWAFAVLQADLLVAATVVYTATNYGFAAWPHRIDTVGAGVLIVAALARVPAAGWPDSRPEVGLVLVRAQVVVLLATALRAAGHELQIAGLLGGAAIFAAGAAGRRAAVRDTAQEAGLVLLALSSARLGWQPTDWVWGALAGGTLIHQLRLIGEGTDEGSGLARAIVRAGGVGLPFLPAAGAVITASLPHGGIPRFVVVAGIAAGLAGRASARTRAAAARRPALAGTAPWRIGVIGAAAAAGLAAPLVALPRPPAGGTVPWPPPWASAVVGAVAAAGLAARALAPADERSGAYAAPDVPAVDAAMRLLDPPGGAVVLVGLLSVLGVVAAGVLVLGWMRGFL